MPKHIDAELFIKNLLNARETNYLNLIDDDTILWAIYRVERFPAAEVEPIMAGSLRINEQGFLECSACGHTLRMPLVSTAEMKRCYVCGAHLSPSQE